MDPIKSMQVTGIFVLAVFSGLTVLVGNRDKAAMVRTLDVVLWAGVIWALAAVIQFSGFFADTGFGLPGHGRATGVFDNLHGSYMLTFLAVLPAWRFGRSRPVLAIVLMATMAFGAVFGGTRTTLWTFCLTTLISLPAFAPRARVGVLLLPVLGALALNLSPVGHQRIEKIFASGLPTSWSFEALDQSLTHRATIWAGGIRVFTDNPVFGTGAGTFPLAYVAYSKADDTYLKVAPNGPAHAHHVWVSVAAETGTVGLVGLITALFFLWRWFGQAPPGSRRLAAPWAVILAAYYFPIASHRPLLIVWWFAFVWLVLCCFLAALSAEDQGSASP